jgi:hypothetical protein
MSWTLCWLWSDAAIKAGLDVPKALIVTTGLCSGNIQACYATSFSSRYS